MYLLLQRRVTANNQGSILENVVQYQTNSHSKEKSEPLAATHEFWWIHLSDCFFWHSAHHFRDARRPWAQQFTSDIWAQPAQPNPRTLALMTVSVCCVPRRGPQIDLYHFVCMSILSKPHSRLIFTLSHHLLLVCGSIRSIGIWLVFDQYLTSIAEPSLCFLVFVRLLLSSFVPILILNLTWSTQTPRSPSTVTSIIVQRWDEPMIDTANQAHGNGFCHDGDFTMRLPKHEGRRSRPKACLRKGRTIADNL
jgi:hypothetical protein